MVLRPAKHQSLLIQRYTKRLNPAQSSQKTENREHKTDIISCLLAVSCYLTFNQIKSDPVHLPWYPGN